MKRLLIGLLLGLSVGIVTANAALTANAPTVLSWADLLYDDRLMSGDPPLPIPPLSEIIGDAATDAAAQAAISDYYARSALRLSAVFRSNSDERTRALFGMYIVHVAVPYNEVAAGWEDDGLLDFVHAPTAHCGLYARAQRVVYDALGLHWRSVLVDDGWHELLEAEVNGQFETFDATSNVWVNRSVAELLQGVTRDYRAFYTPITDRRADDQYRAHLRNGYSVPELRAGLPLWGLQIFPRQIEVTD